jgi:cytochrome c oxidase subunit I
VCVDMTARDGHASAHEPSPGFFARTVLNSDHKVIGLRYLWLALGSVLLGMLLSLVMRIHLVWPGLYLPFLSHFSAAPERYVALTLLHGSLMVFFVLTTAPQVGFGTYFLPLQIGAREMAFPRMNVVSLCGTMLSLVGIVVAFFLAPDSGLALWTGSVALFCLAMLLSSINFTVTTLDLRAKGMSLPRMPITVWAWLVNAILSMLIFSILLGASVLLLSDRFLGSHFFSALTLIGESASAPPASTVLLLWQRLFWFFAQATVYVAILPCFGIVSHLLATFSRKPVFKEQAAVLALCGVGLFGFCVWGEHMFSSGLNPWSPLAFSVLASSLGIPASVLVLSWFGTVWKSKLQLNTAMLFALGFVSLFLSGGVSGIFLSGNGASRGNDFVTGHFHLVMGVAAMFALLAAIFFWFPKMFGRRLNEGLGKAHFWLTFSGAYCVFMPMQWLGLMDHGLAQTGAPTLGAPASVAFLHRSITIATLVTVAAQLLFVANFISSLLRGEKSGDRNPWLATTLEWAAASPPLPGNFGLADPVVFRGAYEFRGRASGEDFAPQNLEYAAWELRSPVSPPLRAGASESQQHPTK